MPKKEDHLDKDVSVSVEVGASGISATARSRLLSGIDRLGGSAFDALSERLETATAIRRAKSEAEATLVRAASRYAVEKLQRDEEFALEAISHFAEGLVRRRANKEEVIRSAIEALGAPSPAGPSGASGPDQLSEDFLDRIERHAENASNELLREKWGRVLAAEVRNPGSMTAKVIRIVDELSPEEARVFERFCRHRYYKYVPPILSTPLSFQEKLTLVSAGLMDDDSEQGIVIEMRKGQIDGKPIRFAQISQQVAVGIPADTPVPLVSFNDWGTKAFTPDGRSMGGLALDLAIPVYSLTAEGLAISGILPDHQETSLDAWLQAMAKETSELTVLHSSEDGKRWEFSRTISGTPTNVPTPG